MAIVPWAAARLLVLQFGFAVWHAKRAARQEEFPHTGIRTSCGGEEQERPLLSILIPARNDEANLGACIASILVDAGIDTDIEVWIVDDESSDGTPCIAEAASRFDSRVRWFPGAPVPIRRRCIGKSHARGQLADKAKGQWLLFLAADTRLKPGSIRTIRLAAAKQGERKDRRMLQTFVRCGKWR
ncbi:MAG: hypothetical protein K0Q94_6011 [Paenibacillus sp.]|nr:hypothetical protein [Paenibacillus sp.]